MPEKIGDLFEWKITTGNILTIITMAIGGLWVIAELRTSDRLFEQRIVVIERKQDQIDRLQQTLAELQGDIRYLRQVIERRVGQ